MLAVFSKLIYLLTLSPFNAEAGLLKAPGVDGEENEGIPSMGKRRSGRSLMTREPRFVSTLPGHSFLRDVGLVETATFESKYRPTPVTTFIVVAIEALITHLILQYSENQTIVFLAGFSEVVFIIGVAFAAVAIFVKTHTDLSDALNNFVKAMMSLASTTLMTALIAKIYYNFRPPRIPTVILSPSTLNPVPIPPKF